MRSSVREALEGQLTKGGHVGAVAGHQEQLGGTLGPRVQTRVQAEANTLIVAGGPVTTPAGSWERTKLYKLILPLGPRVQTRVQAEANTLIVAGGPITAPAGTWERTIRYKLIF
jgi:hypothetical protein